MKKDYTKLKQLAKKLIAKYGMEIVFTMPSLKRGVYNTGTSLNAGIADVVCSGVGVISDYTINEKRNSSILETDKKIIFQSDSVLKNGMIAIINNVEYIVVDPNPLAPDGNAIVYFAQVRA